MPLLDWHQKRVDKTLQEFYGLQSSITLEELLRKEELPSEGLYKVRIVYSEKLYEVTVNSYELSEHKLVKIVKADFEYAFKYESRAELDKFVDHTVDDVIYVKNEVLSDAWYSNLAFRRNGLWYTPLGYMLNGVKRQLLIEKGILIPKEIRVSDLDNYDAIAFVNAMRDFEKIYSFKRSGDLLKLTPITL